MAFEVVGMSAEDRTAWQEALGVPGNVVVEVSSAELLAINSSPIEIIPAPGAGKIVVPVSTVVFYYFGSVPYDNVSSPNLYWGPYSNSNSLNSLFGFANVVVAESDKFSQYAGDAGYGYPLDQIINAPIVLADSANWINGDGTLKFLVTYNTIDA
jgi:hypothetical protein